MEISIKLSEIQENIYLEENNINDCIFIIQYKYNMKQRKCKVAVYTKSENKQEKISQRLFQFKKISENKFQVIVENFFIHEKFIYSKTYMSLMEKSVYNKEFHKIESDIACINYKNKFWNSINILDSFFNVEEVKERYFYDYDENGIWNKKYLFVNGYHKRTWIRKIDNIQNNNFVIKDYNRECDLIFLSDIENFIKDFEGIKEINNRHKNIIISDLTGRIIWFYYDDYFLNDPPKVVYKAFIGKRKVIEISKRFDIGLIWVDNKLFSDMFDIYRKNNYVIEEHFKILAEFLAWSYSI